jgi:hypothetical protein
MLEQRQYGFRRYGGQELNQYTLRRTSTGTERRLENVSWADWDQRGRLVFTHNGQLFAEEKPAKASPRLLTDFNPDKFRRVLVSGREP